MKRLIGGQILHINISGDQTAFVQLFLQLDVCGGRARYLRLLAMLLKYKKDYFQQPQGISIMF
jgi:hypothetical protein